MATATSTLQSAIARNGAVPPVRMTESGSDQTRAGVSLQDQMRAMIQEALAGMLPTMVAQVVQPVSPKSSKAKSTAKPAVAAVPAVDPDGKWYLGSKGLARKQKGSDTLFYSVLDSSVKANDSIMIARNAQRKYGDVLMLVNGKKSPVYLRAAQFGALVDSLGMLKSWLEKHQDYLVECMETPATSEEE